MRRAQPTPRGRKPRQAKAGGGWAVQGKGRCDGSSLWRQDDRLSSRPTPPHQPSHLPLNVVRSRGALERRGTRGGKRRGPSNAATDHVGVVGLAGAVETVQRARVLVPCREVRPSEGLCNCRGCLRLRRKSRPELLSAYRPPRRGART